jgi:hypothetical protein
MPQRKLGYLAGDQTHDLSSTWALRNRDQLTVFIRTDIFEYTEH